MKFVILDLEWNTAYYKKEQRFINEIIEFGAVKLNERMKTVGQFQMFVKSRISKRLRGSVKQLTHISNEQLQQKGKDFETVIKQFTKWAGKNTVILTWSNTDLYTLMDNCNCFLGDRAIPFLHQYADLQKYVQQQLRWEGGNQLGLSTAAEEMGISSQDIDLHRAIGDSVLCARILERCYHKPDLMALVQDTDAPDFYDRFLFKPYFINDLHSPFVHPEDLQFSCIRCNSRLKRNRGWRRCNKALESDFSCPSCNSRYTGRVQISKLYDSVSVKRTLLETDPEQPPKKKNNRRRTVKKPVSVEQETATV